MWDGVDKRTQRGFSMSRTEMMNYWNKWRGQVDVLVVWWLIERGARSDAIERAETFWNSKMTRPDATDWIIIRKIQILWEIKRRLNVMKAPRHFLTLRTINISCLTGWSQLISGQTWLLRSERHYSSNENIRITCWMSKNNWTRFFKGFNRAFLFECSHRKKRNCISVIGGGAQILNKQRIARRNRSIRVKLALMQPRGAT